MSRKRGILSTRRLNFHNTRSYQYNYQGIWTTAPPQTRERKATATEATVTGTETEGMESASAVVKPMAAVMPGPDKESPLRVGAGAGTRKTGEKPPLGPWWIRCRLRT